MIEKIIGVRCSQLPKDYVMIFINGNSNYRVYRNTFKPDHLGFVSYFNEEIILKDDDNVTYMFPIGLENDSISLTFIRG